MKTIVTFLLLQTCNFAFCQTAPTTKGKVKDNSGAAVPFAAIFIKKTNTGIYADSLGNFSIATKTGDTLSVTAIGYIDTQVAIGATPELTVYLKKDTKNLDNVNVKGAKSPPPLQQISIADQQVIANTLHDYVISQNISYSTVTSYNSMGLNGSASNKSYMSVTPASGGFYNGSLLPVYTHIDATVGSRYLFDNWVRGQVINTKDVLVSNDSYYFNYDKMEGSILLTQDKKNVIEVDKQNIKVVELKNDVKQYVFEKAVINGDMKFVQALARAEGKFGLYKTIKTKFKKANYVSTGLTESGHNYDEYIDEYNYYVVVPGNKEFIPIEIKKKSIKNILNMQSAKVDAYFSQHNSEQVDENFLKGLIVFLNM